MLFGFAGKSLQLPTAAEALPHRPRPPAFNPRHFVNGNPIVAPVPDHLRQAVFGLGCFWGAERLFWQLPGVYSSAVGYAGGYTRNPTYQDVCSGKTGHTEVVLVFYDPGQISYQSLLQAFWKSHDPTQGMRQGNDVGTQYRSAIYTTDESQQQLAVVSRERFQESLQAIGKGEISTEIKPLDDFFYAEDYHQQYLAKNPNGYCGLAGTGA